MRKLFMFVAGVALAYAGQAASLDWKYAAGAADVGQTVYVMLGSTAVTDWASVKAVEDASVDHGEVAKAGRNYLATGSFSNDNVTKSSANVYYVIVSADKQSFSVTSVADMKGSVYDPANQESSPGENVSLSSGSIATSGKSFSGGTTPDPGPGGAPEPTSGLLLLVGAGVLGLRRKRA